MKLKADHGYFLIEGSTSDVTHLLNFFAPGNLLPNTKEYNPLSLITKVSWLLPKLSMMYCFDTSSSSQCLLIAWSDLLYPNAFATSLTTNKPLH